MDVPNFRAHAAFDTPSFQLGPFACFCACNPPQGLEAGKGQRGAGGALGGEDEDVFMLHTPQARRRGQWSAPGSRAGSPGPGSPSLASTPGSVVARAGSPQPPGHEEAAAARRGRRGGLAAFSAAGRPLKAASAASTAAGSPSGEDDLRAVDDAKLRAPHLGPVGSGGWHVEGDVTQEMRQAASQAVELYKKREHKELTEINERFLTSVTLANYVNPDAPQHLVNAFIGRARNEEVLSGRKPVYLCCSMRVIGWDAEGASVIATEPSSMRRSLYYAMPQVEYVGWTAFDLNKPGANGFTVIQDFGGGFSAFNFLNPKPVMDLAALVEGQWRRRLKVALLVDMPPSFKSILSTFLMFVKGSTRGKIKFLATMDDAIKELEDMGCDDETIANARAYMVARRQKGKKQRWHPLVDYSFFRERMADLKMSEDSEYITEDVHGRLRDAIQDFRIRRWGLPAMASTAEDVEVKLSVLKSEASPANAFAMAGSHPSVGSQAAAAEASAGDHGFERKRVFFAGTIVCGEHEPPMPHLAKGSLESDNLLPFAVNSKRSISRLSDSDAVRLPAWESAAGAAGGAAREAKAPARRAQGPKMQRSLGCTDGLLIALQMLAGCLCGVCCGGAGPRSRPRRP